MEHGTTCMKQGIFHDIRTLSLVHPIFLKEQRNMFSPVNGGVFLTPLA